MALNEYARKRHFDKTPEPPPEKPERPSGERGGFFCVQRHDASHLHYDFRLEVNGVLVSWAVPKGPSLDPARKALAMKVEDHPISYGTFEGNIPENNYGAGSVMLWDKGSYDVLGDVDASAQIARGDFKFELHGTKLNGAFAIVRMKRAQKGNEWLLIKKPDQFAVASYDINEFAWSIATKRTQEEIANDVPAVQAADLKGAHKAAVLTKPEAMFATAVTKPPSGSQWLYEIKWDGIRALCLVKNGAVQMYTRLGNRCDQQYPELHELPEHVRAKTAWLDGEICVMDEDGRTRFEMIQPRIHANPRNIESLSQSTTVTLFLFDVLYVDGYDVRGVALEERRTFLESIVTPGGQIRISQTFDSDGEQMFNAAREMGLEGIVAKDRRSKYEAGRSAHWCKIKVLNEQEFVIAGFTKGEREYFGSLVLGVQENGKLRHIGQVGTGFDNKKMKEVYDRLRPLITKQSPFPKRPRIKDVTWVRPELVCQIRFLEWTQEGILRGAVFVGLRADKAPDEVVLEMPVEPAEIEGSSDVEALDLHLSGKEKTVDVDGRPLTFTNLEKVFFPKDHWKKRDLIEYYNNVSSWLLPHLKDRPLSLKRYPNGIEGKFFFQKDAGDQLPEWMQCAEVEEGDPPKTKHYAMANDRASLLYLTNWGCIDQNPLTSRAGNLDHPDWILLDLDPVEASFDLIVDAALLVHDVLKKIGLTGFPKTTGGDGMHVYVPIEPVYTFDQVRSFAEILSHLVVARDPDLFTTPRSVAKRQKGRVYFDYLQIGTGKTIAAPYVVRAHDGAPVSTPLHWNEVKRGLSPLDFRMDNAPERFRRVGDLFAPVLQGKQRLEDALERIRDLGEKPASEPKKKRATVKRSPGNAIR